MQADSIQCRHCKTIDDYKTSQSGPHVRADCNQCGRFIKFLPQTMPADVKLYFGKYAGQYVKDITDLQYLGWALRNLKDINPKTQNAIIKRIRELSPPPDPHVSDFKKGMRVRVSESHHWYAGQEGTLGLPDWQYRPNSRPDMWSIYFEGQHVLGFPESALTILQ